jgi:hypothetical protein
MEIHKTEWKPPKTVQCATCNRRAERDLQADLARTPRKFEPFFSEAMGVAEESERLPGETYDANNNILVASRRDQKRLKKKLGLQDLRSYIE